MTQPSFVPLDLEKNTNNKRAHDSISCYKDLEVAVRRLFAKGYLKQEEITEYLLNDDS